MITITLTAIPKAISALLRLTPTATRTIAIDTTVTVCGPLVLK